MISLLQKKGLKFFHPILKRLVKLYLSKPRNYTYEGIIVRILPGVFHPGLFFSTKVFIDYLRGIDLKGKKVLELGAGSGLISLYCCKNGAQVTSSDINQRALDGIIESARKNECKVEVVLSDLFDKLNPQDFGMILINPPYYPVNPANMEEKAWYCGAEFQYFDKIFKQLSLSLSGNQITLMILSEDCKIDKIMSYAKQYRLTHKTVFTKNTHGEENYIFEISPAD